MKPPINEIIGFLAKTQPNELDKLRLNFPENVNILAAGIQMGTSTKHTVANKDEDVKKAAKDLFVRAKVSLSGVNAVLSTCDINLPILKKKLKRLGNIQFASQVIVAVSGATLLTQNKDNSPVLKNIIGILALVASILTLFFQHQSGISLNNSESIFSSYQKLVDNRFEAEALKREIDINIKLFDDTQPPDSLIDVITKANKLCLDIMKMLAKI